MIIARIDGTTDARTTSAVVELFVAYRHFYGRFDTDDDARTFLRRRVATQDSFVWAALAGDDVAGFVQVYPAHTSLDLGTVWWLNDLFVAPSARALGAGRALVQHVLDEAAAQRRDGRPARDATDEHDGQGAVRADRLHARRTPGRRRAEGEAFLTYRNSR